MDFAGGVDVSQRPAGVDRHRVLLVVDPRKAGPVVDHGEVFVHVVCERLVTHPRKAVANVLELRERREVLREHHRVEEGERRAARVADQGERRALVDVLDEEERCRVVEWDGGASLDFGEAFVDSDVGWDVEYGRVEGGDGGVGYVQRCQPGDTVNFVDLGSLFEATYIWPGVVPW